VGTKPARTDNQLVDDLQAALVHTSPVVPVAHAVVLGALAVAGRKLRTTQNEFRTLFRDVDPTLLHTKIRVEGQDKAEDLLSAAFVTASASLEPLGVDVPTITGHLRQYTKGLLVNGIPHNAELLRAYLTSAGIR
jgi:hypothetical protein